MGIVNTEITLKNLKDNNLAGSGYLKPEDIRTETVTAVADTGSMYLVITEELRQKLGLEIKKEGISKTANGQKVPCLVTEAVNIHWKNRNTTQPVIVIPGSSRIVLGALSLNAMDLMIDNTKHEVVGKHGEQIVHELYSPYAL